MHLVNFKHDIVTRINIFLKVTNFKELKIIIMLSQFLY